VCSGTVLSTFPPNSGGEVRATLPVLPVSGADRTPWYV
jgi:hypothetical protein